MFSPSCALEALQALALPVGTFLGRLDGQLFPFVVQAKPNANHGPDHAPEQAADRFVNTVA